VRVSLSSIDGVLRISPEVHRDGRGEFWRSYCRQSLANEGIDFEICQSNVSFNVRRHTLRGFHYQKAPSAEQKILTVVAGAAVVVIVDNRPDSPTYGAHESFRFEVGDRTSVLVASGCATGFMTLEDDTIVHYQMGDVYRPDLYTGFRYDDPDLGVEWPAEPAVVSERDRALGSFRSASR
tara:strand:+ start:1409 stop:1948 length:540 start_codon:yes stop_codon:yes gene_type:complete